jgi:ubiquinone/menaquinone biosynthesis C-methylase UbiE
MPDIILDKHGNEQLFDAVATTYDRSGPKFFTEWGKRLIELMPITPDLRVLDIAAGTGAVLIPAAQKVGPKGRVTGIDLSAEMVQEATRITQASGLHNVDFLKMDAEHLEFLDASFDAVTCGFGIFFLPDMDAAFREMYRVCKPGGFIGITVFDKTPASFTPGFPLLNQQVTAYKLPFVRMSHGSSFTPEEMKGMIERFGFRSTVTKSELYDLVYANTEEWWKCMLATGPRATLMLMDEETRARFKDEYCVKLKSLMKPDGLHMTVGVVYATAQK